MFLGWGPLFQFLCAEHPVIPKFSHFNQYFYFAHIFWVRIRKGFSWGLFMWSPSLVESSRGFPGSSDGKKPTCNAGDMVWSLGWEDPLEEGMATHPSILAWRIPWTEGPGGLQSNPQGHKELDTTEWLSPAQCWPELQSYEVWRFDGLMFRGSHSHDWSRGTQLGPLTRAQSCGVSMMMVSV